MSKIPNRYERTCSRLAPRMRRGGENCRYQRASQDRSGSKSPAGPQSPRSWPLSGVGPFCCASTKCILHGSPVAKGRHGRSRLVFTTTLWRAPSPPFERGGNAQKGDVTGSRPRIRSSGPTLPAPTSSCRHSAGLPWAAARRGRCSGKGMSSWLGVGGRFGKVTSHGDL